MLSSDKPVASSTWLDRLRLSKGLSTTEDDDASGNPLRLDDFLRRNHRADTDSPPSAPTASDPELTDSPSDPNQGEWYGVMSDVLSELFNYSGSSRSTTTVPGKKLPRKQSNPKHCSVETPPPPQRVSSFLPKFVAEKRKRRRSVEEDEDVNDVEVEEEEEEGEKDLVGFSRSEVTVIDTSFKIWKSEKLVFRRRNVWKVRDKKGNSRGVVPSKKKKKTIKIKKKKKKRKCDVDDGENCRKSKKKKLSRSVSDNSPQYLSEEIRDDPESSNANRTLLRRLPSKPRSVLHTSKKNGEPESRGHRSLA
ncbi:Fantom protein [Hirschfeldia incana]|nr:Fantom protein [Hirschfeldia incana]